MLPDHRRRATDWTAAARGGVQHHSRAVHGEMQGEGTVRILLATSAIYPLSTSAIYPLSTSAITVRTAEALRVDVTARTTYRLEPHG